MSMESYVNASTLVIYVRKHLPCKNRLFFTFRRSIQMICFNVNIVSLNSKWQTVYLNIKRSHEYLKHTCPFCSKKFQFPYQLAHHKRQHTGIGRIGCTKCPKTFGAKCSRDFHEKTHGVFMKCQLCPMASTKTFSSKIALKPTQEGYAWPWLGYPLW